MNVSRFRSISTFEFKRCLDLRGELLSLLVLAALALLRFGGEALMEPTRQTLRVATLDARPLPTAFGRLSIVQVPASSMESAREMLVTGNVQAVLQRSMSGYHLHVLRVPPWLPELKGALAESDLVRGLKDHGIARDVYNDVARVADVEIIYAVAQLQPKSESVKGMSIGFIVLTLLATLGCLGMVFHGLVAERFGKTTGMILSAVDAHVWLDAKIVASTLHGLKTIILYGIYTVIGLMLLGFVESTLLHEFRRNIPTLLLVVIFCVAGLALWNWFFATCASLISSPYSAMRNSLAVVPLSLILASFSAARSPEGDLLHWMSYFPLTAMAAMPVRLLNGDVASMSVVGSLSAMLAAAYLLRKLAVRLFARACLCSHRLGA